MRGRSHATGCRSKVRYRDHDEAVRALHSLAGSTRDHHPTRSYPCEVCGGHHLTSQGAR